MSRSSKSNFIGVEIDPIVIKGGIILLAASVGNPDYLLLWTLDIGNWALDIADLEFPMSNVQLPMSIETQECNYRIEGK
jgi:hypothetical protein